MNSPIVTFSRILYSYSMLRVSTPKILILACDLIYTLGNE